MITINGAIYRSSFDYWRVLFWIEIKGDFYTTGSTPISMKRHKRLMFKRAIYHVNFTRHLTQSEFEFELEVKRANYKTIQFDMKKRILVDLVKASIPIRSSAFYEVRKELIKKLRRND